MSIHQKTDLSKFRGCMLGGLLGDCVGDLLQGAEPTEIRIGTWGRKPLKDIFTSLLGDSFSGPANLLSVQNSTKKLKPGSFQLLEYTDDTTMGLSVARSLVEKEMYDPKDMAKKFADEYFLDPYKGYGYDVVRIFEALKKNDCQDVFGPAANQFHGMGSYGNGAAMRASPIALFAYKDEDLIKQIAESSSKITHAHQHGYNGAVLQALAVHEALLADTSVDFNPVQFVNTLLEKMDKIEEDIHVPGSHESERPYCESLKQMKEIFEKKPANVTAEEVAMIFGNSVIAHKSVPAAVVSFLRGFQPLEDFESSNPFLRTLYFAISVGGDTDTIACMAASIAGAYHGESVIPEKLTKKCEGAGELKNLGDQLFQLNQKRNLKN